MNALSIYALVIRTWVGIRAVPGLKNALPVYATVNRTKVIVITDYGGKSTLSSGTNIFSAWIAIIAFGNVLASSGNAIICGAQIAIFTRQ